MSKSILISLLLACLPGLLLAQAAGSVSGKITDEKMNPVKGATITILNSNRITATNAEGNFSFRNLSPGRYTIQVTAIGYASETEEVQVSDGDISIVLSLTEASSQLDAVVVSAEKKDENLQKVPLSISAISARQVQQYRLWNSRDITAIVPNLYSTNSGDDRNVTSIRGVTTTSYDPAVATYIDGVNQFGLDTYIAQLLDIERIEVLRGPQGTLYGRNAMGGVINIITKQPTNSPSGFASANIGNFGLMRYELGFRTPIIKDKLYAGISGMYTKRDGYYANEFNNKSFDKQNNFGGNYYLKYIAAPAWSFTLNLKHQNNRNDGAFPMAGDPVTAFEKPWTVNQDAVAQMRDNTLNSSFVINHSGRKFNFSSQTAYQSNHRYYEKPLDGDFSPYDIYTIINNYGSDWNKVKVWTQEFKFSSPATSGSRLKWTAGTYFFFQDNPVKQATHIGKDTAGLNMPDAEFSTITTSTARNSGIAFYGQATYSITSKLDVIAGIRYDREKKKLSVKGEYQKDPDPDPVFETTPDTSASASFNAFSPKIGLAWAASNNTRLFATYSRGFRTGGLTQLSGDPSQPPLYPYDPEFSNNYELAVKNAWLRNHLRLNLSLFYTTINDAQVPTLVLPDAVTVTRNAGKVESRGFELELAATVLQGLELDYSYGYTKARYKTLKVPQEGNEVNLEGNYQVFTPRSTSMLAVQYTYKLGTRYRLAVIGRGEWMRIGKQYFDLANNISQAPYNIVNAKAGVASKNLELMFWIRNIGSKKFIAYAYDFGAVHLGNPETWGITLSTRF
jgi:iron complex outermembrane receptor protein